MPTPCDYCEIRVNCDFISGFCRIEPGEIAIQRPDLISREYKRRQQMNAANRKWKRANPQKTREITKRWTELNRDRVNASLRARRYRQKQEQI